MRRAPHSRTERAFEKRAPAGFLLGRTDFPFRRIMAFLLLSIYSDIALFLYDKITLLYIKTSRQIPMLRFLYIYQMFRLYWVLLVMAYTVRVRCRRILYFLGENWTDVDGHH